MTALLSLTLEYPDEATVQADAAWLWERAGGRGELHVGPGDRGVWILEFLGERPLAAATIDKLHGRRLDRATGA